MDISKFHLWERYERILLYKHELLGDPNAFECPTSTTLAKLFLILYRRFMITVDISPLVSAVM